MHGVSFAGASRNSCTQPWSQFGHSKMAPRRGAKHVPRSGKIAAPVSVTPLKIPVATIRRSQYLTVVNKVLSDSRKTTLRLEDTQYLIRLVTAVPPIPSPAIPAKHPSAPDNRSYPSPLMGEYNTLIDKKLRRTITTAERKRLQEVRNQIAAIDAERHRPDIWEVQSQKLRQELAELRAEVESLPDAIPSTR